jgi:hypothetical protein
MLPLNDSKEWKVTSLSKNQVVFKVDIIGIELTHLPPISMAPHWNSQHALTIITNSFSLFVESQQRMKAKWISSSCMNPVQV